MENGKACTFHIRKIAEFYIDSFNYIVKKTLIKSCDIEPQYIHCQTEDCQTEIFISNVEMRPLQYPMDLRKHKRIVYPSEARLRACNYYAELHLQICFKKGSDREYCNRSFYVPAMVKSDFCYLKGLNEDDLIKVKEDVNDPGGYFIVNGKERIIRMFTVLRRNYPLALRKNTCDLKKRKSTIGGTILKENSVGKIETDIKYSPFYVFVRSVKDEHCVSNFNLYFLTDGTYEVRIWIGVKHFSISPMLLLKALVDETDLFIMQSVIKFCKNFPVQQLEDMLRILLDHDIITQSNAKRFLGQHLSNAIHLSPRISDQEITDHFLRKYFIVHLDNYQEKFEFLCFCMCKLHCVISKKIRQDDIDNPVFQEILAPGQIYSLALKNGITSFMKSFKNVVEKQIKNNEFHFTKENLQKLCNRAISFSSSLVNMIATGNLKDVKIYGLISNTGYTVELKRTNVLQLVSHFHSVIKFHSTESYMMRKNLRKYYPESWGYLCPVQTPEGEKTGIYNQLASGCQIVNLSDKRIDDEELKIKVLPMWDPLARTETSKYFVIVDGKIIGWIHTSLVENFLLKLKFSKRQGEIPLHSEIAFFKEDDNFFPGIYLFSTPCRMVRKILNLETLEEEFVGCFEQVFTPFGYKFQEIDDFRIFSLSAGLIPFCENNAAVRNIFASVKSKQAMGIPFLNLHGRADTKFQQLIYPQKPLVSTSLYHESGFNLYPYGTNVMIAVLSYSGFDMEDAVTLNKASVERGMMHNVVYKTVFFRFDELANECDCTLRDLDFKRNDNDPYIKHYLDLNGFPYVGNYVNYNDPILSVQNKKNKQWLIKTYSERQSAYIQDVKLTGDVASSGTNIPKSPKQVSITYVIRKIPEVGDKFSNRHCSKGVCGMLMCPEDLPFTSDGIVPDLICNPHSFPSRMSIGMLYEIQAAQVAVVNNSTYTVNIFPSKKEKTYETLGKALAAAGMNYYGTQKLYSGISGEELEAEIFFGNMYYLRLHHLVEEKYQVHSVADKVDDKTYQPINPGRSGAIRFGEMEKDSILSHGAIELTMDRLLHNSDKCYAFVCSNCSTLLYPVLQHPLPELRCTDIEENITCSICQNISNCRVQIPYVLVYLVAELSVMNIKTKFSLL